MDNVLASFRTSGESYDRFMGRYSRPLAGAFASLAGVTAGQCALDVGCGPGALTAELVARLGASQVAAVDPSPPFVAACAARHPGVVVLEGSAEALPLPDGGFDVVLCQLVLHFVKDPARAVAEMRRVARPGATVAACVWDFAAGMQMLRRFWDAALALDPVAPDEARALRFGGPGEIDALLRDGGLVDRRETTLEVASAYAGFDELWAGFAEGIGPAGAYLRGLDEGRREALRAELHVRMGRPPAGFTLSAVARAITARCP